MMYFHGKKIFSENVVISKKGVAHHFPIPTEELVMSADNEISDEERQIFGEFFDSNSTRSTDRFLKIRNFMLEFWCVSYQ